MIDEFICLAFLLLMITYDGFNPFYLSTYIYLLNQKSKLFMIKLSDKLIKYK